MIFGVDAADLSEGDHVIFTKKIKRIIKKGDAREFHFDDGSVVLRGVTTTVDISSSPIFEEGALCRLK